MSKPKQKPITRPRGKAFPTHNKGMPAVASQADQSLAPAPTRAWQLAQLAATLAGQSVIHVKSEEPITLQSVRREAMIESWIESADYLLIAAERIAHRQHAYQLFIGEPSGWLSVNKIARVFAQNNWLKLTHNKSVEMLLRQILRRLGQYAKDMKAVAASSIPQERKQIEVRLGISARPFAHLEGIQSGLTYNLLLLEGIWAAPHEFSDVSAAAVVRAVHQRIPILLPDNTTICSGWGIVPCAEMFHMSKQSNLFLTNTDIETRSSKRAQDGCTFIGGESFFPLFEAKMIHQFDHRFADVVVEESNVYRQGQSSHLSETEHQSADRFAIPRYWVRTSDATKALGDIPFYIVFRALTDATTNARTGIFAVLCKAVTGHTLQMIYPQTSLRAADCSILVATLNSLVLDFVLRQKIGGMHFGMHILKQLPVPSLADFRIWISGFAKLPLTFVHDRVLELTYTAWDLEAFAQDCGWSGPPFRWDEERRFLLRCELDAAFFHLYLGTETEWRQQPEALTKAFPSPRHAVDYILDTFPIVKRKDEAKFNGDYRTKRVILAIYDALAESMQTGQPYQSHPANSPVDLQTFIFMRASTWPDEIRRKGNPYDHPQWHYVNYPLIAPNFPELPSPFPTNDILYGIKQCEKMIKDKTVTPEVRAVNLSWLIHLVGDIHQPLHCVSLVNASYPAPHGDKGGNDFFVKPNTAGVNLHGIWDKSLGSTLNPKSQYNDAIEISAAHTRRSLSEVSRFKTVKSWSEEGRQIAMESGYLNGKLNARILNLILYERCKRLRLLKRRDTR